MDADPPIFRPLSPHEHAGIKGFLRDVTVPMFVEHDGGHVIQGTGTLLRVKGELLLVTAAHVLADERGNAIHTWCPTTAGGRLLFEKLRGKFVLSAGGEFDLDVGIMRLAPRTAIALAGWTALGLSNLLNSAARVSDGVVEIDDLFIMRGFPRETIDLKANPLALRRPTTVLTHHYDGSTDAFPFTFDTRLHLLLYSDPVGWDFETNRPGRPPRLSGISGCSVWCWNPRQEGLWTPERALRVIGVQVGVDMSDKRRWIRATLWNAVAGLLLDGLHTLGLEHLRDEIERTLGEPRLIHPDAPEE
jgi:hypothetical protein